MQASARPLSLLAALALVATTAGSVAAIEPLSGSLVVEVEVAGYATPDFGGFGGQLSCDGSPYGFAVDPPQGVLSPGSLVMASSPIAINAGSWCQVDDLQPADPGNLGAWGDWSVEGPSSVQVITGGTAILRVVLDRSYTGQSPDWDRTAWFPMEVLSVDRVWINRYGGISAEGVAYCPSLAASPVGTWVDRDAMILIGISWDATQYVGRRTTIHGAYGSDIAKGCFDPATPDAPVRWTSMHPSGSGATTAWVYGVDGRFGSGTIIVDANAYNDMSMVVQWWDAARWDYDADCSAEPDEDGWYDANGDGFCAFGIESGQRETFPVRTTTWRQR